jgi:hypothetical protein
MDEHRIGLKPILKKVWCFDGRRPLAPVQHRFDWRYLVGFVHPASGRTIFHLATTVSIPLFGQNSLPSLAKLEPVPPSRLCSCWTGRGGTPACGGACPSTSICSFCPPTRRSYNRPSIGWPLTNTVLVNRHFASIDDLEDTQAERCVALQARPELIRSTTLFHWWPKRIKKRHGPRLN